MRKFAIVAALAVALVAAVSIVSASATSATFTVSPWAFACGDTHYGNPATATDPGGTGCPTDKTDHTTYCTDEAGESPGTASASYAAGKLTLTKLGKTCDFLSSGATIGGLATLTSAGADCLTPATCNPGGNLRLNIVDAAGGFHFVGGAMDGSGHITFDAKDSNGVSIEGVNLKSIDLIADNEGTVALNNLSFVGEAAPTPTPSATASPTATAHPTATPAVVLAQTGGGMDVIWPNAVLGIALALILAGIIVAVVRRRRTS